MQTHAGMHGAEGEFYREALLNAATACDLVIVGTAERDLAGHAASLGLPHDDRSLTEVGRALGAPWRLEHKAAALAAMIALASR